MSGNPRSPTVSVAAVAADATPGVSVIVITRDEAEPPAAIRIGVVGSALALVFAAKPKRIVVTAVPVRPR